MSSETNYTMFQNEMMKQQEINKCPDEDIEFRYKNMVIAAIEQRGLGNAYYFVTDGPKVITSNEFNEDTVNRVINVLYEEKLAPTLAPIVSESPSASRIPSFSSTSSAVPTASPTFIPVPTQGSGPVAAGSILCSMSPLCWFEVFVIILSCLYV